MSKSYCYRRKTVLKYHDWVTRYCGSKCQSCGYDYYVGNLVFHHIDKSTKITEVSSLFRNSMRWDLIIAEVNKCVMVCHNCHNEIHAGLRECPEINQPERDKILEQIKDKQPIPRNKQVHYCKCGKLTSVVNTYCSPECHQKHRCKADWPDNLPELVASSSKSAVARQLGVSDKAVAKRLKNHH